VGVVVEQRHRAGHLDRILDGQQARRRGAVLDGDAANRGDVIDFVLGKAVDSLLKGVTTQKLLAFAGRKV